MGWRSRIREEQTCLKGITAAGSQYLPAGVAVQGLVRAPMQPDRSAAEAAPGRAATVHSMSCPAPVAVSMCNVIIGPGSTGRAERKRCKSPC